MRQIAILAIAILLPSILLGVEVKGRVLSWAGRPIEGALIYEKITGLKIKTSTDGTFLLKFPEGMERVEISISHPDFVSEKIVLSAQELGEALVIFLKPRAFFHEEITVTATRFKEEALKVPAAVKTLSRDEVREEDPPNLAELLQDQVGLSCIGIGGFSKVPAIRGMARRRVVIFLDSAKIVSDRRTGPDASFFSPELTDRVEVVRSASSVFYGSDAVAGVIRIFSLKPVLQNKTFLRYNLSYQTGGPTRKLGFVLGKGFGRSGLLVSAQYVKAEDYSSPEGLVVMSHFSSLNLLFKYSRESERSRLSASLFVSRGEDIGKPSIKSDVKPTWYPLELHTIFQLQYVRKGFLAGSDLEASLFLHPNKLETERKVYKGYLARRESSKIESFDFGASLKAIKLSGGWKLQLGADLFARENVDAFNERIYFNEEGDEIGRLQQQPLLDGRRREMGLFFNLDRELEPFDFVAGLRFDRIESSAFSSLLGRRSSSSHSVITGFAGLTLQLGRGFSAFFTAGRAYRAPSLSELFYTGMTGRAYIISNPELKAEKSLNLDAGLRLSKGWGFAALYVFRNSIDDMIERYYNKEEGYYSYGNLHRGRVQGLEAELELLPTESLRIFSSFILYSGRDTDSGTRLNDIPPPRLKLGVHVVKGRLWTRATLLRQWEMEEVGPAEEPISGFYLLNLSAGYALHPGLQVILRVYNLLDQAFKARPDPDAPLEPGRRFSIGLRGAF